MRSFRASQFETIIRHALTRGPLRYSQRLELLKAGEALGVGRFEANLILAIEQNKTDPISFDPPPRRWFPTAAMIAIGVIQTMLIAAAWFVIQA